MAMLCEADGVRCLNPSRHRLYRNGYRIPTCCLHWRAMGRTCKHGEA